MKDCTHDLPLYNSAIKEEYDYGRFVYFAGLSLPILKALIVEGFCNKCNYMVRQRVSLDPITQQYITDLNKAHKRALEELEEKILDRTRKQEKGWFK